MAHEASMATPPVVTEEGAADPNLGGVRRRDFINVAAVTFAGVGGAAALYPLIRQLARSRDARPAHPAGQEELADHDGGLHPPRLRAAGRRRGRDQGRVRRLFLPLPRLGLRY